MSPMAINCWRASNGISLHISVVMQQWASMLNLLAFVFAALACLEIISAHRSEWCDTLLQFRIMRAMRLLRLLKMSKFNNLLQEPHKSWTHTRNSLLSDLKQVLFLPFLGWYEFHSMDPFCFVGEKQLKILKDDHALLGIWSWLNGILGFGRCGRFKMLVELFACDSEGQS